ncbi:ABC transporter substrate-binding protein [Sulfuricurvum kujiense]|uniref:ABC transporter substrate-binding protein n=1 Tax=Sulfuricurvum kujiense TaxID=148813 RepID=UPI0002F5562E|nr:ABC transporter substrate binding protein [Sulfuricurvum kujiense]
MEYLDTKRLEFSEEYQKFFLTYLETKYKNYLPDAVYVTDDNALKFFLNHGNRLFRHSPVFFSGVNDLSLAKTIDPLRYTGVYETKDIVQNIELIRQFSPQTRDIWILGDDSTTYKSIEADIRKHLVNYPKYTFHIIASAHIHDIIEKLPNTPQSFVLLTTIGGWNDEDGHNLTLKESIEHLTQNPNLIVCSMEDAYVTGGVIGGFVTSGTSQGKHAADLVVRYLKGEDLKSIHSVLKSPNIYMFDHDAFKNSRLILSEYTVRDAVILHKEKSFFERFHEIILDVTFITFVLFFVFIVAVIFMLHQKNNQIETLKIALREKNSEEQND